MQIIIQCHIHTLEKTKKINVAKILLFWTMFIVKVIYEMHFRIWKMHIMMQYEYIPKMLFLNELYLQAIIYMILNYTFYNVKHVKCYWYNIVNVLFRILYPFLDCIDTYLFCYFYGGRSINFDSCYYFSLFCSIIFFMFYHLPEKLHFY